MLNQLVAFILGEQQYALALTTVQRVVRMVEVTLLPKAPEIVLGVIDFQGNIVPVMSMRKRFGPPEPETILSDQLILADTATRKGCAGCELCNRSHRTDGRRGYRGGKDRTRRAICGRRYSIGRRHFIHL
jgi:hypothetical protein